MKTMPNKAIELARCSGGFSNDVMHQWLPVLGALLVLSCVATAAIAQPLGPQAQLAEVMRDPKWIQNLRDHLNGNTSPFIEVPLSSSNRFYYVGSLLNHSAKGCGASISINTPAAQADHVLIILPISTDSSKTVSDQIDEIYRDFPYRISNPEPDVAADAYQRLVSSGISVSDVNMDGGRRGRIVLLDRARLNGPDSDALVDFAMFVGLTGVLPQSTAVDENRFSYLYGGGDIRSMAGDDDNHFGKLCVAVGLIVGVCDGVLTSDLTSDQMTSQINHVSDLCEPGSPAVVGLRHASDLVKQATSK